MAIEITLILSMGAFVVSTISVFTTLRRGRKKEDKDESSQMTTVVVSLETIKDGIKDIKNDIKDVKADLKEHAEQIAILKTQLNERTKNIVSKDIK